METHESSDIVNIGWGTDISIKELAELIKVETGFQGNIQWDPSKPDGQPRRRLDVSRAYQEFGFRAEKDFDEGLKEMVEWFGNQR